VVAVVIGTWEVLALCIACYFIGVCVGIYVRAKEML
jgi:hypothetical protein